ncbi:MAG: shikimate dehydrogenase [Acidobacteriota bacterium]|nr:shikimate dehydrogenase [Acidobacteriota bacterium]NLH70585.1 shikimate dehydrogenase [Brooklawnia sp.]
MRRCAVIGNPIAHSLSPLLHRTAYAQLGIADEFRYDAFEVTPETLPGFLAGLGDEWVGLSVTAPNKQALLDHGEPDPVAAALRAGNTLILGRGGKPNRIYNTDVTGLLAALDRAGVNRASTAILLGNGATARSALWAAGRLGVREVVVCARDAARALASLADIATRAEVELAVQPFGRPPELPAAWGGQADLLISTVPVRLPPELASALVKLASTVFDVVYNFYPSQLDKAAAEAGVALLDGLDLLVSQGVDQIRLMTGRDADPAPLLTVCRAEVLRRTSGKEF